jgi:hypothetical protein
VPFNLRTQQAEMAAIITRCTIQSLPVTYLWLPLTIKKPSREVYYPLLERVEDKLDGWKGKLISKGGRLQLADSVLSAIPGYTCHAFNCQDGSLKELIKSEGILYGVTPARGGKWCTSFTGK